MDKSTVAQIGVLGLLGLLVVLLIGPMVSPRFADADNDLCDELIDNEVRYLSLCDTADNSPSTLPFKSLSFEDGMVTSTSPSSDSFMGVCMCRANRIVCDDTQANLMLLGSVNETLGIYNGVLVNVSGGVPSLFSCGCRSEPC